MLHGIFEIFFFFPQTIMADSDCSRRSSETSERRDTDDGNSADDFIAVLEFEPMEPIDQDL